MQYPCTSPVGVFQQLLGPRIWWSQLLVVIAMGASSVWFRKVCCSWEGNVCALLYIWAVDRAVLCFTNPRLVHSGYHVS